MIRTSFRASLALVCFVLVSACEQDEVYYGYVGPDRDAADGSGDAAGDASDDAGTDTTDDTTPADTGATPDTTDDAAGDDTAVADTGTPDTSSDVPTEDTASPDVPSDTPDTGGGDGACDNSADLSVLGATEDVRGLMGGCAIECIGTPGTCAQDCVARESGLSEGCSACFGGVIDCTVEFCIASCITPDNPECTECLATECGPAFVECAGIEIP